MAGDCRKSVALILDMFDLLEADDYGIAIRHTPHYQTNR